MPRFYSGIALFYSFTSIILTKGAPIELEIHIKKNVLIINHDVDEAESIRSRLLSTVSEVICVTSMQDALKYFIKLDFSLIILDAHMSEEDDHRLLKSMRDARSMPLWFFRQTQITIIVSTY